MTRESLFPSLSRDDLAQIVDGYDMITRHALDTLSVVVRDWAALSDSQRLDGVRRGLAPLLINPHPAPPEVVEKLREILRLDGHDV